MKLSKEEIMTLLPHRDPFLWVDEAIDCEPGKYAIATKYLSPDLPLYKGHFPDFPITPGVISLEAMAQTAGIATTSMDRTRETPRIGLFTGVENARFRRKILPGSTLTIKAVIRDPEAKFVYADCEVTVDGEVAATATISFIFPK